MNPERKREWVAALRSGKYDQGILQLRDRGDHYCCLGVACDLAVQAGVIPEPEWEADEGYYYYGAPNHDYLSDAVELPQDVQTWLGVDSPNPFVLINGEEIGLSKLNDDGSSFGEIADLIDEQL